jgi:hypothetical protein
VKPEVNWLAVSALATVASALIALLTFASRPQGTAPTSAPAISQAPSTNVQSPTTTVALSSLPDPCDAATADTINSFRTGPGQSNNVMPGKGCYWMATDKDDFSVFGIGYFNDRIPFNAVSSPISLPGVTNATKHNFGDGCQIGWYPSFGAILVTVTVTPRPNKPADPCVVARNWVMSVLPNLPT